MMDINKTQNNIYIVSIDVDSVFSKEFCDALFSYVMSCVHDEDMSGDILQDTMVSAIKNLHTVRNPDRIKQWIWKILSRNTIHVKTEYVGERPGKGGNTGVYTGFGGNSLAHDICQKAF